MLCTTPFSAQGRPMPSGGPVGRLRRQRLYLGHGVGDEGGLQHQVLRLVADEEELGQRHEVGAGLAPGPVRRQRLGLVAGDVAHRGVELRHGQSEPAGHRASASLPPPAYYPPAGNDKAGSLPTKAIVPAGPAF